MAKSVKYTDKQIKKFLKDLLNEVDYDIYKTYFVHDEDSDEYVDPERLFEIFREHFEK